MDILSEHRDGEITVFTNNSIPEIHLTTRRAEAKEEVAANMGAVTTVADNMEDVKEVAKHVQTFDDVLLNLPTIIQAMPAAETAVQAKDDAIAAKESAQESAEKAESAVVRAEEVTAEQVELAKGYAEQAKAEVSKVSSAFKIVGTVPTVEDLPVKAEVGDIYLVGDNSITNKPEYVWTSGGTWEKFGETVDLSAYQTKEEAETALSEKQDTLIAGEGIKIKGNVISREGGSVPDNVYTQDNLIAGQDIEFVKETTGGIDSDTLLMLHFDGDLNDSGNYNSNTTITDQSSSESVRTFVNDVNGETKFGKFYSSTWATNIQYQNDLALSKITESFTVDFWFYCPPSPNSSEYAGFTIWGTNAGALQFNVEMATNNITYYLNSLTNYKTIKSSLGTIEKNKFHHLAVTYNGNTKKLSFYLDGEEKGSVSSYNISFDTPVNGFSVTTNNTRSVSTCIDEMRLSNGVRYNGNFTPPTSEYGPAKETGRTLVNLVGKIPQKLSDLENDTCLQTTGGTMTGNVLLDNGAAIRAVGTSNFVQLAGAEAIKNGAMINLFGKDYKNNPGEFAIYARNGSASKILLGKPDGTLTWDGKKVVTTDGGTFTGQPVVKAATSANNKLGLTVAQDYTSGNLYAAFIEGRSGAAEDKILGRAGFQQSGNNSANFFVQTYDPSTNTNKGQHLSVGYDGTNGINYVRAITPPTTSNSTDVVTTQWARSVGTTFAFPSTKWIDWTLGANGTQYTAPANGWVQFTKDCAAGQQLCLQNLSKALQIRTTAVAATALAVYIPCATGDTIVTLYNANGDLKLFRFYYAEGAK